MEKRAEALANAVEDYVFTTEKNLDKLHAAWQAYVDVADEDTAVVAVVDAGELERLRAIGQVQSEVLMYIDECGTRADIATVRAILTRDGAE